MKMLFLKLLSPIPGSQHFCFFLPKCILSNALENYNINGTYISSLFSFFVNFRCSIRFPSTSIRLFFQSLVEETESMDSDEMPSPPKMKPLNINIPQAEGKKFTKNYQKLLKITKNYQKLPKITKKLQTISKYLI